MKREANSDVATGVHYGVASSFPSRSKPRQLLPPFKGEHLEWASP